MNPFLDVIFEYRWLENDWSEVYMGVSLNGGSPSTPKWSCLVLKPMVVGYHHFRTSPYISWKFPYSSEPPEFHDQSGQLFDFLRVIQCHWAFWRTESWLFNDFPTLLDVLCKFKEGILLEIGLGKGTINHHVPETMQLGDGGPVPCRLLLRQPPDSEPRGSFDSGSLPLIGGQAVQGTNYLMNYRDTN